jgi:(p)ppGpp synthase/HD superfamily hydrolase
MIGPLTLVPALQRPTFKPTEPVGVAAMPRFSSSKPQAHNGVFLTPVFSDAVRWARTLYDAHNRADTQAPYLGHYLASAAYVLDAGGSENEAVAALLQGAIKRTARQVTEADIAGRVNPQVARMVSEATEPDISDWSTRKAAYIEQFKTVSPGTRKVIAATMLHNVQALNRSLVVQGRAYWEDFSGGKDRSLAFYRSALRELKRLDNNTLLTELERSVRTLATRANNPPTGRVQRPATRTVITEKFTDALSEVIDLHKAQRRKDTGAPYSLHLFCVASTVLDNGGSEDAAIAALFHDGPEDVGELAVEKLSKPPYSGKIQTIVADCTEPKTGEWHTKKQAYIDHIPHVKDPESLLVIASDKLHNLRTMTRSLEAMGSGYWDIFTGDKFKQLWFYSTVLKTLKSPQVLGNTPLVQEVGAEIKTLRGLMARY